MKRVTHEGEPEGAVLVMRACPMHLGHQRLIEIALNRFGVDRTLVLLGSCATPMRFKYIFDYAERRRFIRAIFPEVRINGIADVDGDETWLILMDDLITTAGMDPQKVVHLSGSGEDVDFFINDGRRVEIVNRFDGVETPIISAQQVRDRLVHGKTLKGYVDKRIRKPVRRQFDANFARLKLM